MRNNRSHPRKQRPQILIFGRPHNGLLPDEIDAFYKAIDKIRQKRNAVSPQAQSRMRGIPEAVNKLYHGT